MLSSSEMAEFKASLAQAEGPEANGMQGPASSLPSSNPDYRTGGLPVSPELLATLPKNELLLNLDIWHASGFPTALSTAVIACSKGAGEEGGGTYLPCLGGRPFWPRSLLSLLPDGKSAPSCLLTCLLPLTARSESQASSERICWTRDWTEGCSWSFTRAMESAP